MIPSGFVFLDAFPLTLSGKVDRKSLPRAANDHPDETTYVAPRTAIEQVLARIWSEVLKLEAVSVRDNFFDLGGHSLFATQIASRIRSRLRVDLPLLKLFEAPTVEELSRLILAGERKPGELEKTARFVLENRDGLAK
jgi:acyl carrier protein